MKNNKQKKPANIWLAFSFALLLPSLITACASPTTKANKLAGKLQLSSQTLVVNSHQLQLFSNQNNNAQNREHAFVFLDGDGKPWLQGGRVIAPDPTSSRLNILPWLTQVPDAALYIGRPCYFNDNKSSLCKNTLWTFSRYSDYVVSHLVLAMEQWLQVHEEINSVTLVGHSGGGIIALLAAEKIPQVTKIVILSTPVDTKRWTDLHNYTPLFDSINPAENRTWRKDVKRYFYFGEDDKNVPPNVFLTSANNIPAEIIRIVPNVGHECCSPKIWLPDIL